MLNGRLSIHATWRDWAVVAIVVAAIVLTGLVAHQMAGPLVAPQRSPIDLDPSALPGYALRTTSRMFAALFASLVFGLAYATLAAKSRRAERILIPVLDMLQSVPILGYLSFTALFFVSLFPGRALGAELAAIFAIFTSQAWNLAFSFYQSLRTIPADLDEASRSFRLSAWQRFWQLEVPFAMPGLVWNAMMSMSGGWFFIVAAEAVSVGNVRFSLPGIGSYVARAIADGNVPAVGWAIVVMAAVIVCYDQFFFRPLVAWAEKYRFEETAAQTVPRSWVLDLYRRGVVVRAAGEPIGRALQAIARARMTPPPLPWTRPAVRFPPWAVEAGWYTVVFLGLAWGVRTFVATVGTQLSWHDVSAVAGNGFLTLARVVILIAIASLVWVPIGVAVGLHPQVAATVQPAAQFLAAFPANLLFPLFVIVIVGLHLTPAIWLTPLMILGTQWYILFNVIAGASAFPTDLREAAATFRIRGWRWWKDVMLPGILPSYVTGAITASGGAWNASIVSEAVTWGTTSLNGGGLGAYIAQMTALGDMSRVALGIAVMALLVACTNRLVWRPLYAIVERRTRG